METKHLEQLLEKYWEGETSLDEERRLRAELKQQDLPEHLLAARDQLLFFEQVREHRLQNDAMDEKVLSLINSNETLTAQPASDKTKVRQLTPKRFLRSFLPIAALVLLFLLAFPLIKDLSQPASINETELFTMDEDGARDAYKETQQALLLISEKLGQGEQYVARLSNLNSTTETYFNTKDKK